MLGWRLFLGPILIAALVGLFALDARCGPTAPVLWVLACLLTWRSSWEMSQLLRGRCQPNFGLCVFAVLAIVSANWFAPLTIAANPDVRIAGSLGPTMLVFALAVMALFVSGLARYTAPGKSVETLGAELLILSYVAVFVSLTVQLRWIDGGTLGFLPLSSLVVATKCGDTSAYFVGRLFGKTKLSPLISPGKTRAGAVGAFIGAAAGSWAWFHFASGPLFNARPGPWYWAVLYGLILGVVGLVGDLAESLIKRDVGQKDSAPLLPGFGGLLDLLDSVIFAGPMAYLLWLVLPLVW
jgi:phosphatidate cytidylyltransferase